MSKLHTKDTASRDVIAVGDAELCHWHPAAPWHRGTIPQSLLHAISSQSVFFLFEFATTLHECGVWLKSPLAIVNCPTYPSTSAEVDYVSVMACLSVDELDGTTDDNLPGQPLSPQTGRTLPWDPGSATTPGQPTDDSEDLSIPLRKGATFQTDPSARRRRPAQQPALDDEAAEEEDDFRAGNQFRRAAQDGPGQRRLPLPDASATRRSQPRVTAGMGQKPMVAAMAKQGMGMATVKQPAPSSQTAALRTASVANQLKVCAGC